MSDICYSQSSNWKRKKKLIFCKLTFLYKSQKIYSFLAALNYVKLIISKTAALVQVTYSVKETDQWKS